MRAQARPTALAAVPLFAVHPVVAADVLWVLAREAGLLHLAAAAEIRPAMNGAHPWVFAARAACLFARAVIWVAPNAVVLSYAVKTFFDCLRGGGRLCSERKLLFARHARNDGIKLFARDTNEALAPPV